MSLKSEQMQNFLSQVRLLKTFEKNIGLKPSKFETVWLGMNEHKNALRSGKKKTLFQPLKEKTTFHGKMKI